MQFLGAIPQEEGVGVVDYDEASDFPAIMGGHFGSAIAPARSLPGHGDLSGQVAHGTLVANAGEIGSKTRAGTLDGVAARAATRTVEE